MIFCQKHCRFMLKNQLGEKDNLKYNAGTVSTGFHSAIFITNATLCLIKP